MSREYRGNVRIGKLYQGEKSVGVQLKSEQALDLAIHLLNATKDRTPIDITIFTRKKNSAGYYTTVTFKR